MDDKKGFVFYRSFYEAANDLETDAEKLAFIDALIQYALYGKEPQLTGALRAMFHLVKPQIDKNNTRYENGKKGGAPVGNTNAKNNQRQPKTTENNQRQPKDKVKDKDKVKEKVKDKDKAPGPGGLSLSFSLLGYLNEKTGSEYTETKQIDDLLLSGYTEADIKAVIDKKVAEWSDVPKMRGYLRPSTLFGKKFAEYLGGPDPSEVEEKRQTEKDRADLIRQKEEKTEALRTVRERLEDLAGDNDERETYGQLKESELLLTHGIEHINKQLERLGVIP